MLKKLIEVVLVFAIIMSSIALGIIVGGDIVDGYNSRKLVSSTYQSLTDSEGEKAKSQVKYGDILGIIKIEDIDFEGVVYEGTTQEILKKGVGHFQETPVEDGNICFAAHNTNKFWAKLKDVKRGSKILYRNYQGEKEYEVFSIKQIEETDSSLIENTEENMVTLITCVKGQKNKRLCVQAKQKNI